MKKKTMVIVHHTGMPGSTFETITNQHVVKNGWAGVGYHIVIEKSGNAVRAREDSETGIHTIGANAYSLGICLCGDFNQHPVRPAQWSRLTEVVAEWCAQHGIIPGDTTIVGHRDKQRMKKKEDGTPFPNTCPGKHLYERLPELRCAVAAVFWRDGFTLAL